MKNFINLMSIVLLATLAVFGTKITQAQDDRDGHQRKKPVQVKFSTVMRGTPFIQETMFTVPRNKQLTIEFVSCFAQVPLGQFILVGMDTDGGGPAPFDFFATKVATLPNAQFFEQPDLFMVSQQVRLFADPATEVKLRVTRSLVTGDDVSVTCAFAGQLSEDKKSR